MNNRINCIRPCYDVLGNQKCNHSEVVPCNCQHYAECCHIHRSSRILLAINWYFVVFSVVFDEWEMIVKGLLT